MTTALVGTHDHVNAGGAGRVLGCTRQRALVFAALGLLTPVIMGGHVFFSLAPRSRRCGTGSPPSAGPPSRRALGRGKRARSRA